MNVIGVNPDAFLHRPDEEYLSATWTQHLDPDANIGLEAAVRILQQSLSVNKADGYAIGEVGPIKAACAEFGATIRVLHEPDPHNDAHVALRRIPRDNPALRQRLATMEWSRFALDRDFH